MRLSKNGKGRITRSDTVFNMAIKKVQKNKGVVIYQAKNGAIELRGDFTQETIWATQAQIVQLFGVDQSVVSRHIKNIFKDGEIEEKSNMQKMHTTNTIKECFDIILRGDKGNSRLAARKVRKLLYGSQGGRDKFDDIKNIINSAPVEYAKISEEWRQENFITAISVIYYLHDKGEQPNFLFSWLFLLLQHPNGVIRYASVRMFSNEIGPLTVHIRFPEHPHGYFGKLVPEKADNILYSLFMNINELIDALWQPKYKRYKYVDSLPASPYKSAQMLLAELEESCGKEYIDRLIMTRPIGNSYRISHGGK